MALSSLFTLHSSLLTPPSQTRATVMTQDHRPFPIGEKHMHVLVGRSADGHLDVARTD